MWSEATPRAIFPQRRVGCLEDGCEASLLVLAADPSADFAQHEAHRAADEGRQAVAVAERRAPALGALVARRPLGCFARSS